MLFLPVPDSFACQIRKSKGSDCFKNHLLIFKHFIDKHNYHHWLNDLYLPLITSCLPATLVLRNNVFNKHCWLTPGTFYDLTITKKEKLWLSIQMSSTLYAILGITIICILRQSYLKKSFISNIQLSRVCLYWVDKWRPCAFRPTLYRVSDSYPSHPSF